jgi:hypothetical protein
MGCNSPLLLNFMRDIPCCGVAQATYCKCCNNMCSFHKYGDVHFFPIIWTNFLFNYFFNRTVHIIVKTKSTGITVQWYCTVCSLITVHQYTKRIDNTVKASLLFLFVHIPKARTLCARLVSKTSPLNNISMEHLRYVLCSGADFFRIQALRCWWLVI